jgi:GTA TIM-barrel-like domain/Putative phage tail protein
VRDETGGFPAVAHLRQLAAEVRLILPSAKISYAADWSEYFGYHPQDSSNDVFFNLDPLWADTNIDFVGIDWYVPLADWREGNQHLDAASYRSIYDKAYLASNVAGGEGYDWFYASLNDRQNQLRSPITDGVYAKDWVFRYKDLRSWWASQHYDRPGGIELSDATDWIPESKPVWFTETGCPAIDKGANQPNVFVDPKSSESTFPYFSRGRRDDFIQRMYIDAITSYWTATNNKNPVSSVYGAPMIDEDKILIWTWDARPFPQFPALEDVWSDGVNWEKGHWLNGRLGLSSLAILIQDICARAGITTLDVSQVEGLVTGYVVTGPTNARAALESILEVYGVELLEVFDGLRFQHVGQVKDVLKTALDDFVQDGDEQAPARLVPDNESLPLEVRVQFTNEGAEYQPASANARDILAEKRKTIDLALPLVSDREFIRNAAEDMLSRAKAATFSANITLPPSFLALEPGDAILVPALDLNKVWRVKAVDDALQRELTLVADSPATVFVRAGAKPGLPPPPSTNPGPPVLAVMDLPLLAGEIGRNGPKIAAFAEPWTQDILFLDALTQAERSSANTPAIMGEVISALPVGGISGRWDYATQISVKTYGGALSSATQQAVLAGENVLAIEHDGGQWEVLQFQNASLTGTNTYSLFGLLRGQSGSDDAFASPVSPMARWVLLNGSSNTLPMQDFESGVPVSFLARPVSALPGSLEELPFSVTYADRVSRMPSPVHIGVRVNAADVELFWIRRARKGGDYWGIGDVPLDATPEAYRVRVYAASAVLDERIVSLPKASFSNAELDGLFPLGLPATLDVGIAQYSPLGGAGIEARKIVYI